MNNDENPLYASAPFELGQKLENDIPGIDKVVRIQESLSGEAFYEKGKINLHVYFADPDFFQIFNFPLVKGDKQTALSTSKSVVLTETEDQKIFGNKNAMGEFITIEPYGDFQITGVVADLPGNSHLNFGAVASYTTLISPSGATLSESQEDFPSFRGSYVYFQIKKDADPDDIEHSLNAIAKKEFTDKDFQAFFELQPLNEIVPGPGMVDELGSTWSYENVFRIGLMVLIILIPAYFNYTNLSISQSLDRMKEIGVRKVMGGQQKHIFLQFIIESTTIVFFALLFSYFIFEVIRGDFLNQLLGTSFIMDLAPTLETYIGFIFFALLVGVAAGIIPALYFSQIATVNALKGKELPRKSRFSFRKIIITSQFILSLGFIMAVIIAIRMYNYNVNYDFGFEQEDVLDVQLQGVEPQIFHHEFGKINSLQEISMSSHLLGIAPLPENFIKTFDLVDSIPAFSISINETFISNMKLKVLVGRDFNGNPRENSRFIIVNEEFMKNLKARDSVGAMERSFFLEDGRVVKIGGIVKNFHYANLKKPIGNFFFEYDPSKYSYANIKLESKNIAEDLAAMEIIWKKIGGEREFIAELFSNEIKGAYSSYKTVFKIWSFLAFMTITMACLGLLGTVSYNIKKRTKEISTRKVLGASTKRLVMLLSKDFIILIIIASVITIPIVYSLFSTELAKMQYYSLEIGFIEIALSLVIIMVLSLTTIFSQTMKAASANPVDNLRSE